MAISKIHISFPTPVEISEECQRFIDEALTAICEDYELSNPSRVMWVFGVGGTPPPGFMFDEPHGDWDMSTLNYEITERERYEGETTTQHSDLRRVFHERDKFRDQVIDTCKRAERAEKACREETGWLIERIHLGRPMWLTLNGPHAYGWTGDSIEALRFGRSIDADQYVATHIREEVRVTDHAWVAAPAINVSPSANSSRRSKPKMEATNYQFRTFPWPPPNDRQDRRFYLFGFDADNQPYIVRWCDSVAWNGWRAVSLDTKTYDSAEPVAHAIEGENVARLTLWADAPLLWSVLGGKDPMTEEA